MGRVRYVSHLPDQLSTNSHMAHLQHIKSRPEKYQIVGLLNSSVANAKAAIERYGLLPTTRAYASPEELATDSNVDLVVCATRVDRHYETLLPAVRAGKNVFTEWPLAVNLAEARLLTEAAQNSSAKTVIGLQGHASAYVQKIKEIIASGRIGKVLSTTVIGTANYWGPEPTISGLKYFAEKKVGGNMATIHFAHCKFHLIKLLKM